MSFRIFRNIIRLSNSFKGEIQIRSYARWQHRTPRKILTESEFQSTHINQTQKLENSEKYLSNVIELEKHDLENEIKSTKKAPIDKTDFLAGEQIFNFDDLDKKTHFETETKSKPKKSKNKVKYTQDEILDTTFDQDDNFVYNKMRDNDPRIGQLMLMVKSKKLRDKNNRILLEGKRLILDALENKCNIEHLMFSRKTDLENFRDFLPKNGVKLYKMAYRDIQMWSDLTTSPGIMAIAEKPDLENLKIQENFLPITIICDNIREPGNLGAILRTSVAVGCENVILTKGCVDLWEPKVLRSASGAHFRVKIQKSQDWSSIKKRLQENTSVFLADNNAKISLEIPILPYYSLNYSELNNLAVIIGGETHGLSPEAYNIALELNGVRLNVPLSNHVDSLNTGSALAVIVFEIKKQFLTMNK